MLCKVTIQDQIYEYESGTSFEEIVRDLQDTCEHTIVLVFEDGRLRELHHHLKLPCPQGLPPYCLFSCLCPHPRSAYFCCNVLPPKLSAARPQGLSPAHSLIPSSTPMPRVQERVSGCSREGGLPLVVEPLQQPPSLPLQWTLYHAETPFLKAHL